MGSQPHSGRLSGSTAGPAWTINPAATVSARRIPPVTSKALTDRQRQEVPMARGHCPETLAVVDFWR